MVTKFLISPMKNKIESLKISGKKWNSHLILPSENSLDKN
jgi:hypothetical protein